MERSTRRSPMSAQAVEIALEFLLIARTLLRIPSLTITSGVNTVMQSKSLRELHHNPSTSKQEPPHA
jgi:hypothetical protein